MAREPPDYLSYLLRLWRVRELGPPDGRSPDRQTPIWRASLQSPQTGERVSFATLDALFAFLREQTGMAVAQDDTGPGERPDRSKYLE